MPEPVPLPELLSPAGDWECCRAAIENGADAIYFGLERFNARMRARNFTVADLPELMAFLHRRGVRGYVTFNTLVFADEMADAEACLRSIIAAGVDAAIVQDIGICRLIRELSPDFPIHASTQMTVTSAAGVAFARDLGANLVVLARENSLADIERIRAGLPAGAGLPLEVFVHGALCVAFSGQCLTSEALGGRSANRGECAQACRLPYELISDGQPVALGDRRYLLSPQDLAGLEVLPDIIRSGVSSLKIEGRLKSPEYVASITRVYRQALDSAARQAAPAPAKYELEMAFSRGLSTGWFQGVDNQSLVHARFGTKRGVFLGAVESVRDEAVSVRLEAPLKPGDGVVFDAGRPDTAEEGGRVYEVRPEGAAATLRFGRGDIDWRRVQPGQRLWKTDDPALRRELRATFAEGDAVRFRRPIALSVAGALGAPLQLRLSDDQGRAVTVATSVLLEAAVSQPLTEERLREQLGRLGGTPFRLGAFRNSLPPGLILPVKELNRVRREGVERLLALRARPPQWRVNPGPLPASAPIPPEPGIPAPDLIAVIRLPEQLEPAWNAGARTIYCEFENPKRYRDAVAEFRALASGSADATIWVAPPRIFLPGEEWILRQVESCAPDGFLARNYDHLRFYAGRRLRGDFSLNVANPWSAEHFLGRCGLERVTASYDLNLGQLEALLRRTPGSRIDITVHQHMPMFHMNHCVFCAFLSTGRDYRDCGRPCESHRVSLRDRVGADLPLKADAGCRNTVFNNRAQTGAEYMGRLKEAGAVHFRIEFVNEGPEEVALTLDRYRRLLAGEITGPELWKELRLLHQLGVTRGQMDG